MNDMLLGLTKYVLPLLFMLFFWTAAHSDTTIIYKRDTPSFQKAFQNRDDTILHKGVLIVQAPSSKDNDNVPWIVALVIGVFSALVNVLVAWMQNRSNRKTIDRQLFSAQQTIHAQINSAKEIATLEFNRTVKSHNRQEWINLLRNLISEIDTKILHMALEPAEKTTENVMAITWLKNKIELMLNTAEIEHRTLLDSLNQLIAEVTNPVTAITSERHNKLRTIYFNATKAMLKMEWERVKKGE